MTDLVEVSSPAMHPSDAARHARRLRLAVPLFVLIVAVICIAVLIGWFNQTDGMRSHWPAVFVMKFDTAAVLLMFDLAMLGLYIGRNSGRLLTWLFGIGGLLIAAAVLSEYLLHVNLGIDQLWVRDYARVEFPGRTSPGTASCFLLLGLATVLTDLKRCRGAAQLLFIFAAVTPLVTLGGYLYHAPGLVSTTKIPIVAVHTAICQSLLCLAGLFVRPDAGLMRVVVSDTLAGSVARKLLPTAVLLPLAVGQLVTLGERVEMFSVQFGSALLVSCCAMCYSAAVWVTTSLLWGEEKVRAGAEAKLRANEQELRQTVVERDQALVHERATRIEVERASRMKDEFLATLSHELRTPLNAILGWSQILSGGTRSARDLQEGLATIERNARAQTRIVEDLLDMSRIISGNLRLDIQPIFLRSVIAAAIETVQAAADAKAVLLATNIDPSVDAISGDPHRLQQVIWNLLSNAIRFTPKQGRITVRARRVHSHVEIKVVDSGEGIAPDFLPYVFDRFRQADASTTRRHGGLGLGLSIVKQLVELHGGVVAVTSGRVGAGTTFTITLPLTAVRSAAATEIKPPGDEAELSGAAGQPSEMLTGLKVLVVDDELDARNMLKRILQDCNADVTLAASAAEALAHLSSGPTDVLVSDIGMPGDDGYSLIRQVRSLMSPGVRHIPAIALTAYSRPDDRLKALRAGFQMHLAKPAEPSELVAVVASLGRTLRSKMST